MKPTIVVDIDGTIANIDARIEKAEQSGHSKRSPKYWDYALSGDLFSMDTPIPTTPECMQKLAREAEIVYMSGRRAGTEKHTQDWLREHGFPDGNIILRPKGTETEQFKTERIAQLKEEGREVVLGIGNSDGDIRAYEANGLRAMKVETNQPWAKCPRIQ